MLPSLAIILASLCAVARARFGGTLGGYNLAQTSQYHIQTDEGPERYFRYQTDSGQYRKEKRLEDGTVVGTYGWVDAAGYLRLRDYVADNQGYRIVRTKKLWVGDEPIGRAVATAKYAPSQGGVGVANAIIANPTPSPYDVVYQPSVASVAPPETVYVTPPSHYGVRVSTTPAYLPPAPATSYLPPVSSTPRPYYPSSTPAAVVSSTPRPYYPSSSSTTAKPFVVVSSTPAPAYASSSASPSVPDATPSPIRGDDATAYSSPHAPLRSGSRPHPFHRGVGGYSANLYDHAGPATAAPPRRGYISELPGSYDANSNSVIPEYDGIAVTHNGFRYYLPRQYQEEENLPGDRRAGSFGYVDPFGIRRVIYYNSSPGSGFQVRKNNRYVGFNSTPYDPRF